MATHAEFCLNCHDGPPPTFLVNATAYVPATVTVSSADSNKYAYRARGHWEASGSIGAAQVQSCPVCHDSHGSKAPKLLGAYQWQTATNTITYAGTVTTVTANDNTVCYACHTAPSTSYPTASLNASGYPTDGTWTGRTTYTVTYVPSAHTGSFHSTATASLPTSVATPYPGGGCKNCHDVHGTANAYDELRTESTSGVHGTFAYTPRDLSFCFNCHDATGPSVYNIKAYFPTTASGSADPAALPRSGHRTTTAGVLPSGSALPCYYCHNPHGSDAVYGLLVLTRSNNATIVVASSPARSR